MEESIFPFNLVDKYNEKLRTYNREIQIVQHSYEPQYYAVQVVTLNSQGDRVRIDDFADNYYEHELADCVDDAFDYIIEQLVFSQRNAKYLCYRKLDGWTHGTPALVQSLTEFPVFFHDDEKDTVENISDNAGGIDAYENRHGFFCVHPEDYELALRQINDHDERGVEH